ncbi:MAG: hypothetical protein JJ934_01995 [Pseudomonadales bacterium]|nr:hypothetical protein [Pseudomonadales bacterium]
MSFTRVIAVDITSMRICVLDVTTVKNERDARQSLAKLTKGGRNLLSDVEGVLNDFMTELKIEHIDKDKLAAFQQVLVQLRNR